MPRKKTMKARGDTKYVDKDEKYDFKQEKKQMTTSRIPGIADALKKASKMKGYSKKPKVKPTKKR